MSNHQTPNQRFEQQEKKVAEIKERLDKAIVELRTRHEENPTDWNVVSDFGMLTKAVEDALEDNGC